MVERFHRQLKAAVMTHESPNPESVDNYTSGSFTRHPIGRQGNVKQIGRRDDLRKDTTSIR